MSELKVTTLVGEKSSSAANILFNLNCPQLTKMVYLVETKPYETEVNTMQNIKNKSPVLLAGNHD
jgi:hypothetical protein